MPWLGIRGNGTLSHALPRKFRLVLTISISDSLVCSIPNIQENLILISLSHALPRKFRLVLTISISDSLVCSVSYIGLEGSLEGQTRPRGAGWGIVAARSDVHPLRARAPRG